MVVTVWVEIEWMIHSPASYSQNSKATGTGPAAKRITETRAVENGSSDTINHALHGRQYRLLSYLSP
jgi:hypothetical protein